MRAYTVTFMNPTTNKVIQTYSSISPNGGLSNTGALNIEFDIPTSTYASPLSSGHLRIWGISLATMATANSLNGSTVLVYAGMAKGLPLADPSQFGLIAKGTVLQAFGNWIGTEQTLEIQMMPFTGAPDPSSAIINAVVSSVPRATNLKINWRFVEGDILLVNLDNILDQVYSGSFVVDISGVNAPPIIATETLTAANMTLQQFAIWINKYSKKLHPYTADGREYSGYEIDASKGIIRVFDNEILPVSTITLKPTDLIGQPTWVNVISVQATLVMRSDIQLGSIIQFPEVPSISNASSLTQFRSGSIFQNQFQVMGSQASVRHVGNFRGSGATSWVTVVNAVQLSSATQLPASSSGGFSA